MAKWIWLDKKNYEAYQRTNYCCFVEEKRESNYCVADFRRTIPLPKPAASAKIRVSGDTFFRLWQNGKVVGIGPVAAGGDFLCQRPMPVQYLNTYEIRPKGDSLTLLAEVQLSPVVLTDYSSGQGGFYLELEILYEDGTRESFGTDESWEARIDRRFVEPYFYDGRRLPDAWNSARETENVWNLREAPIPMLSEQVIFPCRNGKISLSPGETLTRRIPFDRIYSGYIQLRLSGKLRVHVGCYELEKVGGQQETIYSEGEEALYRSFQLHSIGGYELELENLGDTKAAVEASLIFTCYPVTEEGSFETSDPDLNRIYEVCKWTLQICRQSLHLDSPMHQEPLACTGDYYIESLMTAFTFGDMRLARLDVVRTADWLRENKGVMFHTSYSLIWVQMLYEVYRFTGDTALLAETEDALGLLLNRFRSYVGENGILEDAPDYMFVDWVVTEGYTMHHPPKALGQTPLCAFYHGALQTAAFIYGVLKKHEEADQCREEAEALKKACNELLYDEERGLYFDGLPTPTKTNAHLPENISMRHFSRYGNTLAVLYDLCEGEKAKRILEEVMTSEKLQAVQPYFMHFVLEALSHVGLFDQYGISELRRWKVMTDECDKGLKEGWFAPQEDYSFDYSHAWGGTPAYQLPAKLLGFRMIEPGFRRISLNPKLYDLDEARISMPTPYGMIVCRMKKGSEPVLEVPREISCTVLGR